MNYETHNSITDVQPTDSDKSQAADSALTATSKQPFSIKFAISKKPYRWVAHKVYRCFRPQTFTWKGVGFRVFIFITIGAVVVSFINLHMFKHAGAAYSRDAASGKGMICYNDGSTTPKVRLWNSGSTAFDATETSTAVSRASYQTVIKQNPVKNNEWFCAVNDNAGNLDILRSTDGGSNWSVSLAAATIGSIGGTGTTRRFDMAFEQQSGQLVLAYSKNATTNELATRFWNGSSWSSETTYDPAATDSVVTWIELAERSNSDELALGYITNDSTVTINNIGAIIWNGSTNTLGNATAALGQCDQTAATPDGVDKCMDMNYENGSGLPVMSWGITSAGNSTSTIRTTRWDGSAWTTNTLNLGTNSDDGTWVDCESDPDPTSLVIACSSYGASTADVQAWTESSGTLGVAGANIDTAAHTASAGHAYVATTFLRNGAGTFRAVMAYADAAADTGLDYSSFDGSTWAAEVQASGTGIYATQEESIQVVTDNSTNASSIFYVLDAAATTPDLYAMSLTMSSTGSLTTASADSSATLEPSGNNSQGLPVSFAFEPARTRASFDQKAYIWENSDEDYATGDAYDGNSQLAAGNTSITIPKGSTANLRIQLQNTGSIDSFITELGLFYDRNDGIWSKLSTNTVPKTTSGSGCTSSNFTCTSIASSGSLSSLENLSSAVDQSGSPWVAYYDSNAGDAYVAHYVGSGGTGCSTTVWTCTLIESTNIIGSQPSIAIDQSGNPWIAYYDITGGNLRVARYVGSGGTGCASTAWTCTAVETTNDIGNHPSIAFDPAGNPWITHSDVTNFTIRTARYVGTGGTGCASTAWTCTAVVTAGSSAINPVSSLAFDPNGRPWFSYHNGGANADLYVAKFVGSGGTGCTSTSWTCTSVYTTNTAGAKSSLAFDSSGNPWVSFLVSTSAPDDDLYVAKYVGSGGTGCASTAWTCTAVDTTNVVGTFNSLAFDSSGNAWISYFDGTNSAIRVSHYVGSGGTGCASAAWSCSALASVAVSDGYSSINVDNEGKPLVVYFDENAALIKFAKLDDRAGELLISPTSSATNGDSIAQSHTDMTTVSDSANKSDADCVSGTWANGSYISTSTSRPSLSAGTCTELEYTIDTSQAVAGTTYRIALASKDNWNRDKGAWRGLGSVTQYATITVVDSVFRAGKDNSPEFANCTGNTNWGCQTIDSTNVVGSYTSMAFDSSGTPWVSYLDGTNNDLRVARYVGTGGSGCASSAWNCTAVDTTNNVGLYTSIAFDANGNPWVSYYDSSNIDLRIARYVGTGGTGCAVTSWTCTTVDSTNNVGTDTSIAFDSSGTPWISYSDNTNSDLRVARYVGTGGTGCAVTSWTCTSVYTTGTVGTATSIAVDSSGNPWISYTDNTNNDLLVARYVGNGGTGCAVTSWTCTTVDTASVVAYTSIGFDSSGIPWIAYYDSGVNGNLRVAQYVGTGGTGCAVTSWTCTAVDTTNDVGSYPSLAFDSSGNQWVSYYDVTNNDLRVARYVGTGGTGCAVTSWTCTSVDTTNDVGSFTSIAFDANGTPWISNTDGTNSDLRIAKLHRPLTPHSFNNLYSYKNRSASHSFARYKLSPGSSPLTSNGSCGGAIVDLKGLCALFQNQGDYDSITTQINEQPYLTVAAKYTSTTELPQAQWFGRSTLAPSTAGTTGDIVLQVYRYGTTNAWETVASDTTTADCNTPASGNCSLSGVPSGTSSDYFYNDGAGGYWVYFRLYQEASASTGITFKTDQFKATRNERRMRHGQYFQDEVRRPLNFR